MEGVTGNANPDNWQVKVRSLDSSTKKATDTATATGKGTIAAKYAKSILSLTSNLDTDYVLASGTTFTTSVGITVTTDTAVRIPAENLSAGTFGQANVSASATVKGTKGNTIPAGAINQNCCVGGNHIFVKNNAAFSGGVDQLDYKFLQQRDMDTVTNADLPALKKDAQTDITNQIKPNEQLLDNINCDNPPPTSTPDKPVGDHGVNVASANVTVSVSCSATVYDAIAVRTIVQKVAPNELKQRANKDLGTGYVPTGNINIQPQRPEKQQNNITFPVITSEVWYYNWPDTHNQQVRQNLQKLLSTIKKTSKTKDLLTTLNKKYTGISNATTNYDGPTLPSDVCQIILEVNVPAGQSGGGSQKTISNPSCH